MNGVTNMTKGDYIPGDITVDILSKLPAKSVLRFKIACKTWYSLISDPLFVNFHTKRAPQSPKILYRTPYCKSFQILDYESSSFNNCCLSGPIDFPRNKYFYTLVGSSCGLVCLDTDRCGYCFIIWNPLTNEFRKLPNLSMIISFGKSYFHGLGYDSVSNDFKFVISYDRIRYNVFSLEENSWKTIICPIASKYYHPDAIHGDRLHGIQPWNSLAIVLNGIFHWLVAPANRDFEIVAFDVRNETFQKLQLPEHLPLKTSNRLVSLLEHRGYLCVSFLKRPGTTEIWMMEEYGVWIHLLSVNNSSTLNILGLPVLSISMRSEVVIHTDEKFSRCGKLDEKFLTQPCRYQPVLYVETLVSPNTAENRLQVSGSKYRRKRKRYMN